MAKSKQPTTTWVPPHSIEAEQAVLGALMLTDAAYDRVADRLVEEDFYRLDHRLIFRAIAALVDQKQPCDAVTMGEWFEAHGHSEQVGGSSYILELASTTPSAANIVAYADIVREKSILRQLIDASTEIGNAAVRPDGRTSREVLETAERRIFAIAENGARGRQNIVPVRAAIKGSFEILQQRYESKGAVTGVSTGYTELDEATAGLQPGNLIVVAGRPSMGKTALSLNIAEHTALVARRPVLVFTMEMSNFELGFRLISSVGRIDSQRLRTGNLDDDDWPRVSHAITRLAEAKLFMDETPALSPTELRSRARRFAREQGVALIVIDYLQLMTGEGAQENRATELSGITRDLKALAKELNVPVMALSQLNRNVESRTDKRPVMSDLRESGSIEQDADVILMLYRDEYYDPNSADKGVAEVIIGKQHNGPTGTVRLAFQGRYTRFDNLAGGSLVRRE
jgi:replicative DNA helicase